MKKLAALLAGGLLLAAGTSLAFADPVPPTEPTPVTPGPSTGGGEKSVTDVLIAPDPTAGVIDDINGGGVTVLDQADHLLVFSCPLGTVCPGGIIIEQAGFAPANLMGIYDLTNTANRVAVFTGPDTGGATKSFQFDIADSSVIIGSTDTGITFGSGTSFGFFIDSTSSGGNAFFSGADATNVDGKRHVLTYHTEAGLTTEGVTVPPHSFIFAFEDLPNGATGADFDYNDFFYHFQLQAEQPPPVIPEPASMLLFGIGGLGMVGLKPRNKRVHI